MGLINRRVVFGVPCFAFCAFIGTGVSPSKADQGSVAGPGADLCNEAVPIEGAGPFSFNNQFAEQDGPADDECVFFGADQIAHDVWFAWFAPSQVCKVGYVVETCGLTNVDTKIAVYSGATCPPPDPIGCSDDDCGTQGYQTRTLFQAQPDGIYLIRIGTYAGPPAQPGGSGQFRVVCADPPANDDCADAQDINTTGDFAFDLLTATMDGPPHADCAEIGRQGRTDHDLWYCWTAPCTDRAFVSTCDRTTVDTKIMVYESCECPVSEDRLLACSDDSCGLGFDPPLRQSSLAFNAVQGQTYLIRLGTYDGARGGVGTMAVTCGLSVCPGAGSCFTQHANRGCSDGDCCEKVCAADAYCCNGTWDSSCALRASGVCTGSYSACSPGASSCFGVHSTPGCNDVACCNEVCAVDPICCVTSGTTGGWDGICVAEAQGLCTSGFSTCGVATTECDAPFPPSTPGCSDADCCNAVCAIDTYCCREEWDQICSLRAAEICQLACATATSDCSNVSDAPGCGDGECCADVCSADPFCCLFDWDDICVERAIALCAPNCPTGTVTFEHPPSGVVYAGFANDPFTGAPVGLQTFGVTAPAGAAPRCWSLCETDIDGTPNTIVSVETLDTAGGGDVFYLITLARPITANAVTTLTYTASDSSESTGEFISHMGNVDPSDSANAVDIATMIDCCLRGTCTPAWGQFSCDMDGSGGTNSADVLGVIDALNGAGPLDLTMGTSPPSAGGICPAAP